MTPPTSRDEIRALRDRALADDRPMDWFEPLYVAAQGDPERVPWALEGAHPALVSWLSERPIAALFAIAPTSTATSPATSISTSTSTSKPTALVIGCGLGDDAEAIAQRGFQVTAFDVSPRAIAWCRERFPDSSVDYCVADLLASDLANPAWRDRFDLVFECRTVQALPLSVRDRAIAAVVAPVAPGGRLVVVTHTRPTEAEPDGPPWPLSPAELAKFSDHGLTQTWARDWLSAGAVPRRCLEFVAGYCEPPSF